MQNIILTTLRNLSTCNRLLLLLVCISMSSVVHSAGTAAGTIIKNNVEISYKIGTDVDFVHTQSARHNFTVSELIRSNVTALEPQGIGTSTPASDAVLSFQLTNTGNGDEAFLLSTNEGLADQFKPDVTGLWIETNGIPGVQPDDTLYQPSSGGVLLEADQSATIYVVSDIPAGLADESRSDVSLVSTSGTPNASSKLLGESIEGLGDNGIEAVVAQNNARHSDSTHYLVSTVILDVEKTIESVKDPYGTDLSMPGSEVTYKIRLVASGRGTANNLVIDDAVPASMTYKLNSMTHNGAPLSDRDDSDIGRFDRVQDIAYFSPGTIVAPATHEYTLTYIID